MAKCEGEGALTAMESAPYEAFLVDLAGVFAYATIIHMIVA